jgi:ABC-2 type transport system permease protein
MSGVEALVDGRAGGQLWRTARAVWWTWKAEFSGAAEYRADLLSGSLVSACWMGVSIAPVLAVSRVLDAPGWSLPNLLFLMAVWYLLDAVVWMILVPNCSRLPDRVQDGTLDGVLLRPVSSLVMCTVGSVYVQDVPKVVLAVGVGSYAVAAGGGPASAVAAVATAVAVSCACVLMWAIGVLTHYKALSAVRLDAFFLVAAVQNVSRVPTPLYGPLLHVVMTFVLPISFLATVPAQLLFGAVSPWWAVASVGLTAVVVALTAVLWNRELRRYTGAMG